MKDQVSLMMEKEYTTLRQEVLDLKNCQVTFLTFSLIATGAILGVLGGRLISLIDRYAAVLYLAPLTILLPSWLIFFDKALSVTRIVGYLRLLEEMYLGSADPWTRFLGWETAMDKFRARRKQEMFKSQTERFPKFSKEVRKKLSKMFRLQTTQRYWVLVYYIFSITSGLCLVLSSVSNIVLVFSADNGTDLGLAAVGCTLTFVFMLVTAQVARWNLSILFELIWGKHKYENVYKFWIQIHSE